MDDETIFKDIKDEEGVALYEHADTLGRPLIGFIRKLCDRREEIMLEHEFRLPSLHTRCNILHISVIHHYEIIGISCYSICLKINGFIKKEDIQSGWKYTNLIDYIRNISYIPKTVLDMIPFIQLKDADVGQFNNITREFIYVDASVILARIKKQIMDKLKEDESFQQLSKLNIVDELHKNKQEIIEMKSFIQQLQEDMKQLVATTSKIQQENTLLTNLLEQEKEKTKHLSTTIQELQGLSFISANAIGQALMCESDIFNCM
jgi:hypothetical protein